MDVDLGQETRKLKFFLLEDVVEVFFSIIGILAFICLEDEGCGLVLD